MNVYIVAVAFIVVVAFLYFICFWIDSKQPENPASIKLFGMECVKISLSDNEKTAFEDIIISGNTMKPLQCRYIEYNNSIYLWRGEPVDNSN